MRFLAPALALALLAAFSPVFPTYAFTAKLNPPWGGEGLLSTRERNGRGGDGELQIIANGIDEDGDGESFKRKRRRRRSSTSSTEARAVAGDNDLEERGTTEHEDIENPDLMSDDVSSQETHVDKHLRGWPNESSTLRAYTDFIAAASDAGTVMLSNPSVASPSLAIGGLGASTSLRNSARGGSNSKNRGSTRSLGRRDASSDGINGNGKSPFVRNYIAPLLSMTRPDNFPGVLLLHTLGAYKALQQELLIGGPLSNLAEATGLSAYTTLGQLMLRVLREPRMMFTLVALLLTTATSMLVNDYYDARSGVDLINVQSRSTKDSKNSAGAPLSASQKPLATGAVPLPVAKRFLYYLYASLLLSVPFVPGAPAQMSVILGAMFTFLYTQHLKPVTWLKNALCAGLIAFSPLTSGMAATSLVFPPGTLAMHAVRPAVSSLYRLVITLFAGFMSREILMDITDVEGDRKAGVQTVPVRHGLRYASKAALVMSATMAFLAIAGPASRLVGVGWSSALSSGGRGAAPVLSTVLTTLLASKGDLMRLALAAVSTGLMLKGAWSVYQSGGRDRAAAERAIGEGKLLILPLLASFI